MGKDHYRAVKDAFKNLGKKSLKINYELIVSEQSPDKINKDSPISYSFSIFAKTIDGRSIKFLFYRDKNDDYNEYLIDLVFDVLENHNQNYPNDRITRQANKLSHHYPEIYLLFDESTKEWKVADILTGNFVEE